MKVSVVFGYAGNNEPNNFFLTLGSLRLWFSYKTVIAFQDEGIPLTCRVNDWKQTTGKHLNAICPNHKERIDGELFEAKLKEVLLKHGLGV